jgi:transitional endoplasmic reticulum ATPase
MSQDITTKYSPEVLRAMLAMMGEDNRAELERLAWENKDTDIAYTGDKIILPAEPAPMSLEAAIEALERKREERDTRFDLVEQVPGFPFDAMVALVKAMKEKYGWASVVPAKSFFDVMPDMHTVRVGPKPKDTIQVPMGRFKIPGVEEQLFVHIAADHSGGTKLRPVLCIHSNVKLAEKQLIMDLVALTKEIMARESIYKGRPLRLKVQADGEINFGLEPDFIDVSRINKDELVLSQPVMEQVEVSLLTPIKHTAACMEHKIPLKRGILLAGQYGTGKTLTSSVVARVCEEQGWTFIALDDAKGLKGALEFAKQYEPAVVFAEDIDRVSGVRTDKVNDLLNMVDGILTKESKVITVLTTNHVDKINQAMLRPGRLDAVIMVTPPDSEAVQRLLRMYGRGLIAMNEPLERIGKEAAGRIPAILREIVERSKLSMVANGRHQVIEDDLLSAYRGMKGHLELLEAPADKPKTAQERMGDALAEIVFQNSPDGKSAQSMEKFVTALPDLVERVIRPVQEGVVNVQRQTSGMGDMHSRVKSIHENIIDGTRAPKKLRSGERRDEF